MLSGNRRANCSSILTILLAVSSSLEIQRSSNRILMSCSEYFFSCPSSGGGDDGMDGDSVDGD